MIDQEKITSTSKFEVKLTLSLSETEARALKELTVYGTDVFLKVFYEKLGRSSLEKHEKGIISLFETIKKELPHHLNKADKIREVWNGKI